MLFDNAPGCGILILFENTEISRTKVSEKWFNFEKPNNMNEYDWW